MIMVDGRIETVVVTRSVDLRLCLVYFSTYTIGAVFVRQGYQAP